MKKYILNVDRFEDKLYTRSKYDTSPRFYGNIEIDEKTVIVLSQNKSNGLLVL